MDKNYEAQRHLASQRLDARRQQGEAERLLKMGQRQQPSALQRLLAALFRRPRREAGTRGAAKARPAVEGRR